MQIEETTGQLRRIADLLFAVARELSGNEPELSGGWYKMRHAQNSGFAWVRFIGERARRYPPQSAHIVVFPHPEFCADPRLETGTDWWGKEDRHVVATAGDAQQLAVAVEVIARAFWIESRGL